MWGSYKQEVLRLMAELRAGAGKFADNHWNDMTDQRHYKATLFASLAQSNFIGVGFGLWLGIGAPDSSAVAAALVFVFWMAASCRIRRVSPVMAAAG